MVASVNGSANSLSRETLVETPRDLQSLRRQATSNELLAELNLQDAIRQTLLPSSITPEQALKSPIHWNEPAKYPAVAKARQALARAQSESAVAEKRIIAYRQGDQGNYKYYTDMARTFAASGSAQGINTISLQQEATSLRERASRTRQQSLGITDSEVLSLNGAAATRLDQLANATEMRGISNEFSSQRDLAAQGFSSRLFEVSRDAGGNLKVGLTGLGENKIKRFTSLSKQNPLMLSMVEEDLKTAGIPKDQIKSLGFPDALPMRKSTNAIALQKSHSRRQRRSA